MPYKPHKTPQGTYRIRGTYQGVAVDKSVGACSHAEAVAIADAMQREVFDRVVLKKAPPKTFAEVAIEFMEAGRSLGQLAEGIIEDLADRPIASITNADVERLRAKLYAHAKPSSANRNVVAPISAIMHFAADADYAPLRKWKRFPERQTKTDWLRPAQVEAVLAAMREPESRALAALYVGCGLRTSEGVFLHGQEVAPDLSQVTVLGDARRDAGTIAKGYQGTKGKRTRTVEIPPRARQLLAPVINTGKGRALRNSLGREWSGRDALKTTLRRACIAADVPEITPHDLRHTFATWHNAVHGDPILLMRVGGWGSLRLVERYAHVGDRNLRDEVIASGWSTESPEMAPDLRVVDNRSTALRLAAEMKDKTKR